MRVFKLVVAAIILAGLIIPSAAALGADFVVPEKEGRGNLILPAEETRKNLYVAGGSVTVDSAIDGDLFVAGGAVTVNGPVSQDVFAMGGTVILNGDVGGDVRIAGGTLQINSKLIGDLLMAGGTANVSSKSSVGGDLIVGAGDLNLDAPVGGSARVGGGDLAFNSVIKGDVWLRSEGQVRFGPNSKVMGSARLRVKKDVEMKDGSFFASSPKIEKFATEKNWSEFFLHGLWVRLLGSIFAALLLVWLFPRIVKTVTISARTSPGGNLGFGLLAAVVVPVLVILGFAILIGFWAGLLLFFLYIAGWFLAAVVADLLFGAWLLQKLSGRKGGEEREMKLDWQAAVIGSGVLTLISFIPIAGWLFVCVLTLMCFGAISRLIWQNRGEKTLAAEVVVK